MRSCVVGTGYVGLVSGTGKNGRVAIQITAIDHFLQESTFRIRDSIKSENLSHT